MQRIDGPGATPDNKFTEGDPALGVSATTVTANYMNGSQEEFMSVIEKSFQTPDSAQNDQVLKGIFRLSNLKNLALNADFQNRCRNPDTGAIPAVGGLPSGSGLRIVNVAGWEVDGTVDTTGNTGFYNGDLVTWSEPDPGFVNHVAPNTAGQYLNYSNPQWAGYRGGQYSLSGPGAGVVGPLQSLYLTVVLEVANNSTSPGTLSAECPGFASTISSALFSVEVLEATSLTLTPGQNGKISMVVKITNLTSTATPITGPVFRVTFNSAGSYSYFFKRYAIYQAAIPRAYLPQWTASNDVVDRLFAEFWSASKANAFTTGPLMTSVRQTVTGNKATVGRLSIPLLFPATTDEMISGSISWLTALSDFSAVVTSGTSPVLWMEDPATGIQTSMTAPPVTISFVRLNEGFLHLGISVAGFSRDSPLVGVSLEADLTIKWRKS